jgi:hypothetical protein
VRGAGQRPGQTQPTRPKPLTGAAHAHAAPQVSALLLATAPCTAGGQPCALRPLAGRAAAAYTLDVAATSARLRPLGASLAVAVAAADAPAAAAWAEAAGLPAGCVCAVPGAAGAGAALAAAAPRLCGSTQVVLLDAAAVLEPGTRIARMVESAIIRRADAVVAVAAPLDPARAPGGGSGGDRGAAAVQLESPLDATSRVVAVLPPWEPHGPESVSGSGDNGAGSAFSSLGGSSSGGSAREGDGGGGDAAAPGAQKQPGHGGPQPRHQSYVVLSSVCVLSWAAFVAAASDGDDAVPGLAPLVSRLLEDGFAVHSWRLEVGPGWGACRPFLQAQALLPSSGTTWTPRRRLLPPRPAPPHYRPRCP